MKTRRAFTLVEVLIALTIFGFASVGMGVLLIAALKMYAFNNAQLSLVSDVRRITSGLSQDAEFANYFVILPSFTDRTTVVDGTTLINAVSDGKSGNCLVLITKNKDDTIKRVVCYYWVAAASGTDGVLRGYDTGIDVNLKSTKDVWDLMPKADTQDTNRLLVDHVSSASKLFYNYYNRSIITNCKISETVTKYKNATITYNYTVSPRG